MNPLFRLSRCLVVLLALAAPTFAQLTLIEEGGTFFTGNFAPTGTPFAKDVFPAPPSHTIAHLNDGTYGNSNSWINNSADSFAGINLGATPVAVNRIAFGRDNLGNFGDRCVDLYTIQYTTEANPNETTTAWTDIGTVFYAVGGVSVANPALRHAFSFPTVNATGIRIITATSGTCIDEIELAYVVPGAPTDIALSASTITENNAAGATIGTLTATDEDAGDTHTFTFAGGADDAAFTITGNVLTINASADFETKPSYSIRIRATDSSAGALTFEKSFTITVVNVAEQAPYFQSSTRIGSIPNHNSPGLFVMSITAGGTDAGTAFTYSLSGGPDDAAFSVTGDSVYLKDSSDFTVKSSYTFRFRATNTNTPALFHEEDFTFYVKGNALEVKYDDTSIANGATGVNIGVQFVGDVNNFVLKNVGTTPMTVNVLIVAPDFTVAAVGGSGTGYGGGTGSTGSATGSTGSGSGTGGPLATVNIDPGQTAFITLTYNDSGHGVENGNLLEVLSDQQANSAFTFYLKAGNPRGNTVVNDTFTSTSGASLVAPLANDGSPEVTITRVVGGNATISADKRHLIIAAGFTGTLTYVTSNDATGTVTIVAGTPVATPTKWLGLLRDTNGKIVGEAGVAVSRGKYTAALNVGHVKGSTKFTLGTPVTTKLGAFNATLDGNNHLQVTLGTNTGDLRPLVATATAAKYNAALQATDANLLGGGYSNLEVKKTGMVKAKGTLPDGTKFSTASTLSDDSSVVIYTPIIATKPKGTLAGQFAFSTLTATDLTGEFAWVKPAQTKQTGLNASGVDAVLTLNGCAITPAAPPTNVNLDINLIGANFSTPVAISPLLTGGKAPRTDPLKSLIINGKTNAVSGSVIFPTTTKTVPFSGVFLPKNGRCWGFLKGDTAGGRVDGVLD